MSNMETKIKVHNSYHYKLIDANGQLLEEKTIYNTAFSGIYVADIRSSVTTGATFRARYKGYHLNEQGQKVLNETYSYVANSLTFNRITAEEDIDFGQSIEFVSNIEYPASTTFVGEIDQFSLGSEIIEYDENHQEVDRFHWSECSVNIEKTESTILIIGIQFYITASQPNLPFCYDKELNSILNTKNKSFPTPAPSWIGLSPLIINHIPNQKLRKLIPTVCSLPLLSETNYLEGTYKLFNPTTTTDKQGYFFLPSTGSSYPGDGNKNYNFGVINSIVYGNIGAEVISGTTQVVENPIIIPIVRLNLQSLADLLEDEEATEFYFYGSIPYGCGFKTITINGQTPIGNGGIEWINPNSLTPIVITGVAMETDEIPKNITSYRSDEEKCEGEYYANYIFSTSVNDDYWEPPSGSPVSPNYIYFNEKPHNITLGSNIGCTIQGQNEGDSNWTTILSGINYKTVYIPDEVNYNRYRALVVAPSTNSLNYFINSLESTVLSGKTYDPNVIRIGNNSNDYGKTGIKITRETIETWQRSIAIDQQETNYTIGISIDTNGKFYKAGNSLAYLKYGVITSGS